MRKFKGKFAQITLLLRKLYHLSGSVGWSQIISKLLLYNLKLWTKEELKVRFFTKWNIIAGDQDNVLEQNRNLIKRFWSKNKLIWNGRSQSIQNVLLLHVLMYFVNRKEMFFKKWKYLFNGKIENIYIISVVIYDILPQFSSILKLLRDIHYCHLSIFRLR